MLSGHAVLARANPVVPLMVILAGLLTLAVGSRWIGAGIAVGAVLAFVNTVLLSTRVEMAADTGDATRALMVMQIGLLATFVIIGVTTVILVRFSLAMAIASAAGFLVAQLAMLAVFYWTKGRSQVAAGRRTT